MRELAKMEKLLQGMRVAVAKKQYVKYTMLWILYIMR